MNQVCFVGKLLTKDWLTPKLPNWERLLEPKKSLPLKILEVGSFEGRSAIFFLEYLPRSYVVCVDTFKGGEEHTDPESPYFANMPDVENRFDHNLSTYGPRVEKIKGDSINVLPTLREQGRSFDVAYIDADHRASSVFFDACFAWEMLAPDGIMILDDYLWEPGRPSSQRPKAGIDAFLKTISGDYVELHRDYQIIIQKQKQYLTLGGRRLDELSAGSVRAPFVSLVVINWNYGAYVHHAIQSIKQQDYRDFECLVIDNSSTDNSKDVIEQHVRGDSRFRAMYLEKNMGQLGAAIWALSKIEGGFVTFVDADDVLFRNFASTHLQVHMAVPQSVAFTSSAVVEMNGVGHPLTSSYDHVNVSDHRYKRGLRSASHVLRFPTIGDDEFSRLCGLTAMVPRGIGGWRWGPGTSNMFRKSLLDLVKMGDGTEVYMRSADGHFNRLCHAVAGSALIDIPLSAYRIHSNNYFVGREGLKGLRKGTPEYAAKSRADSYQSVELSLQQADRFGWLLGDRYWPMVDQCTDIAPGEIKRYYRADAGVAIFLKHAQALRSSQGDRKFTAEVLKRLGHARGRSILKAGFGGTIPLKVRMDLMTRRLGKILRVPKALKGRGRGR